MNNRPKHIIFSELIPGERFIWKSKTFVKINEAMAKVYHSDMEFLFNPHDLVIQHLVFNDLN